MDVLPGGSQPFELRFTADVFSYYAELANRARLMYHVSPFATGARPVPFSFDWSIDYYPPQYRDPGPEMSIYQLSGGKCASWTGSRRRR